MWRSVGFILLQVSLIYADIGIDNGGKEGEWGQMDRCPTGTKATGVRYKCETNQGHWKDDTAMNAIGLLCTKIGSTKIVKQINSSVGAFGKWSDNTYWCETGYIKQFKAQVQEHTGINSIIFLCSDSSHLEVLCQNWGEWGAWSPACSPGVCGIKTRVESPQGIWEDDSSLNDLIAECCYWY